MYIRIIPRKKGDKTYLTASLVEGFKDKQRGYVRHRVIRYFGSVSEEEAKKLKFVYSSGVDLKNLVSMEKIELGETKPYGDAYVLKSIWDFWGISEMVEELVRDKRYKDKNLSSQIALLTINRCIEPLSENKIKDWYKERSNISHLIVLFPYPQKFYRALKALDKIFPLLQEKLADRIKAKIYHGKKIPEVYYDLTSTYFESAKLCVLAAFGYSRDKRSDKKQIILGLVIDKYGFPLWAEIFPGNTADKSTLKTQILKLKERLKIKDVIIVGDRGLMSKKNILEIVEGKYDYLIAMKNSECKKIISFTICPETMEAIEEDQYIRQIVKEKERYIIYLNIKRREKERESRERNLSCLIGRLEEIKGMIKKGRIKSRDILLVKLGEAIKQFSFVKKYIKIIVSKKLKGESSFLYEVKREKVEEDENFDGVTVLKSNLVSLAPKDIISTYKNLNRVEGAFRCLKDVLKIRPINHHIDETVRGHIYVCILAYLLMTTLQYRLRNSKDLQSAEWILKDLSTIKLGEILVDKKPIKKGLTPIGERQKKILKAIKIPKIKF